MLYGGIKAGELIEGIVAAVGEKGDVGGLGGLGIGEPEAGTNLLAQLIKFFLINAWIQRILKDGF